MMDSALTTEASLEHAPRPRAIFTLVVLALVVGVNNVDRNMFSLVLPAIKSEIHLSDTMLGFLSGPAFIVVYSVSCIPIAWLADRANRRNIIAAGLIFWSFVTLGMGAARNVVHLVGARMLLGVGEATNIAPGSAMIADLFPQRHRALAFAAYTAGGPLGIMVAFPFIGWISQARGWRSAFVVMGIVGLAAALLMLFCVREPRRTRSTAAESRSLTPRESLRLAFGSRPFLVLVAGATCMSATYGAMLAWVPTFFVRVHHLQMQEIGAYLGLYRGFLGVLASLCGGLMVTLLTRLDGRWLVWVPAALCLSICPAELLLLFSSGELGWQLGLACDTFFMTAAMPCTFALLITVVDSRMRALGTALYLLVFHLVGQSVGPLVVGLLNEGLHPAFGESAVRYALLLAPLCAFMAGSILLMLTRHFPQRPDPEHV